MHVMQIRTLRICFFCAIIAGMELNTTLHVTYPALVGAVIIELRKSKNISQSELATRVDLSQATLSRIEKGDSALTVGQLGEIADVIEVQPFEILKLADDTYKALDGSSFELIRNKIKELSGSEDNKIEKAKHEAAKIGALAGANLVPFILQVQNRSKK